MWLGVSNRRPSGKEIDSSLEVKQQSEAMKWCEVLKRFIDIVLFLRKRNLPFYGSKHRIEVSSNVNLLLS